jgi:hypothetical protein
MMLITQSGRSQFPQDRIILSDLKPREIRMEWGFVTGLSAITLFVIGLVIYFGLRLNKSVLKHAPEIAFPINITFTGTVLLASVVGFWIICLAAGKLRPESSLGAFVGTADGVAAVIVGSIFVAGIAGAILEKLGFPIAKKEEHS